MLIRSVQVLLVACLGSGTLWAANDPFAGKWKIDPSKSILTDEMKVDAAGPNRYALAFGPGAAETILADGSDQPAMRGTTFSITVEGPNNWKMVRKKDGHLLISAEWTLSADGNTLTDAYTGYDSKGTTMSMNYVYQRTSGGSGFVGTWDSVSEKVESSVELEIKPYESDGLTFESSGLRMALKLKFDGKDYPDINPASSPDSLTSGRRVNGSSLELARKYQGTVVTNLKVELSGDKNTLTLSMSLPGQSKAKNIWVFDRE